jgi:hypothetical protein
MKIQIHYKAFVKAEIEIEIAAPMKQKSFEEDGDYLLLDWLFREFNRVDDNELISILGITTPSLSVGDEVEIDGRKYSCAGIGWERVN